MNQNKIKKMAVLLNETLYPVLKEGIRNKVSKEAGLDIAMVLLNNLDATHGLDNLMKEACENTNNIIKENFLLSVHHASNIKGTLFKENVLEVVKAVKAERVEDIVTERFEALKNINLAHAPEDNEDSVTPDVGTGDAEDGTTIDGGMDFAGNTEAMESELGVDTFTPEEEVAGDAGDFDEIGLDGDSADIFNTESTDEGFSFEGEGDDSGEIEGGDDDFSFSDDSDETVDTVEAEEEEIHKESIRRFREGIVMLKNVKLLAGRNGDANVGEDMVSTIRGVAIEGGADRVADVADNALEGKVGTIVQTAINTIQAYIQSPATKDLNIIGELTLIAKLLGHAINQGIEEGVNNFFSKEIGALKQQIDTIDGTGAKYSIARGYLGLFIQILEEKIGIEDEHVFNNAAENHIVQESPLGGDIAVSYVIAEADSFYKASLNGEEGLVSIDDIISTPEAFKNYLNDELSYMGESAPIELRNLIGQMLLAVDMGVTEVLSSIIVSFGNVVNYDVKQRKALREIILTALAYCNATGRGLDTILVGNNEVATKIMAVLYLTVDPSETAMVEEAPMGDSDTVSNTPVPVGIIEEVVDGAIAEDITSTNLIQEAATYKIDPNMVTYQEIEGMVNALEENPKAYYSDEELKEFGTELNDIYGKVISGGQPIFKKLKAVDFGRRCVDMLKPSKNLNDAILTRLSSGKNPVTKLSSLTDDVLKYASRSGLIALSMLAPVAGIAVATFAVVARMLSQRERETSRKALNHEIAKLNVAKSMAKDSEVEAYLDSIIAHYTKILQYVEGNYNANKEISGIRKTVEALLKSHKKASSKIIKESRVNRMVIESATSIYRENCVSDAMGGHVSIFKGIVESVLKGEVDAESIPALTESLNDAVKSYIRLVNYNLSKEPNTQASSLVEGVTALLTAETIDQNGLVQYIMNNNVLTSDNDTYKGLVAIPFAYLSLFALAEEGITADRDIITQAMADLEYMDSAKSYAVSILAALAGNEGAIKYSSFDLYNLISPKSETEEDVDRGDIYEEAYNGFNMVDDKDTVEAVERAMATSDELIAIIKDNAKGIDNTNKLNKMARDKIRKLQYFLDKTKAENPDGYGLAYSKKVGADYSGDAKYKFSRFIREMMPIIDTFKSNARLDAETEKRLLNLTVHDPASYGTKGMQVGAFLSYAAFMIPLIPFAYMSGRNEKRYNASINRVLPKVIVKSKLVIDNPSTPKEEKIMHELFIMHLMMMMGGALATDTTAQDMVREYGVSHTSDLEGVINAKFKELKALAAATTYKEAPHAMSAVTVNSQLKGIKKLNKSTIEMLKEIAEGNVDKYRMDEKIKTQLKAFYDNAAYLEGDIKGMALLTGLGPKFEKPAKNFVRSLKEFLKGAFPIIEAFRSQASIEKEIEAKIMGMLNPINTMARNAGYVAASGTGFVVSQATSRAASSDIQRHVNGAPMVNPLLTTLGLVNAGAMVLFMVGLSTGERKRRKALLTVCERLEYRFKALMKSKAVDKTEKDLYELMLMHVMLVHKYIDPETYTERGLSEYAVDLENEIDSKFDEIVNQIGVADKFKEARALVSTRKYRESLVLSRLAKAGRFKENAMGDIEEIGDAATEALIELVNPEYISDESDYAEPTEDVMGDTFETVTEVIVEEPTADISTVATAITEDIAEEESTEGDIYQESVKSVKAELGNFVNAKGEADAEAILAVMNSLGDGKILFRPSPKLARKFVDLVNFAGARTLGEQGYTNMSPDVLLSDSANASEFRKEFFRRIVEHIVDTFGGLLSTKADFEYACILGLHTPIRMAEISKGLTADNKAVVRIAKEIVLTIDTFTTTSASYKKLKLDKKEALLDVKAAIASTTVATKYKESIDRDYSPAVAAIGTYAIGLDTLLNEKGSSIDFIKSMIKG